MPTDLTIVNIGAWEVLDSRGRPTVACEVRLASGATGTASVPSGMSVGRQEAFELRDGGTRYLGYGVQHAVHNVKTALRAVAIGRDAGDQEGLDAALRDADGSVNLARLGANAVLAVSVATAVAAAAGSGVPVYRWVGSHPSLPLPMINIVSGGAHARGLVDIQDVLVVPVSAASFAEALEVAVRVRAATAEVAESWGFNVGLVADEGGLGVPLASNAMALELVCRGIERAGLRPGDDVSIALDIAASQLYRDGRYVLATEHRELDIDAWVALLLDWCTRFPIVSVEDPCAEDDWAGWQLATEALSGVQIVGDDLFVTSVRLLERGIDEAVGNAILVKPNQNGTLSGARRVMQRASAANYATVVSARSGETEDSWLADLAVGWGAGQIKVGSTTRSERTAKWNRLLRIEQELGAEAYVGSTALAIR